MIFIDLATAFFFGGLSLRLKKLNGTSQHLSKSDKYLHALDVTLIVFVSLYLFVSFHGIKI